MRVIGYAYVGTDAERQALSAPIANGIFIATDTHEIWTWNGAAWEKQAELDND